jgi:glycosyltransferase involved in cell wall biosynthesis
VKDDGEWMKTKPRVTVITVFLNAGSFLKEAVQSVLAQSYDEWELLLIDDGSGDGSSETALRYVRRYPERLYYLDHPNHENRGISASQNLGIRGARGEYIAFLDADDIWAPEKLEQQVEILDSQPESMMLYGQTRYWYSWSDECKKDLLIDPGIPPDTLVRPPSLLASFLREEVPIPCPSDVLVRRNAVLDIGGFEETFHHIFTDQAFYAKLCLKWPVFVSGRNWSKYRKHANSAVAAIKKMGKLRSSRLAYLNWLKNYLDEHDIRDREVRNALKTARLKCLYPRLFRLRGHVKYRALMANEFLRLVARQTMPAPVHRLLRDRVRQLR